MSLSEVFTLPISIIKTYQNSGVAESRLKTLDYENEKFKAILDRLNAVITVSARR